MGLRVLYHPVSLLLVFAAVALWSGIGPADRFIWFLEVLPAFATMVILLVLYPYFRFTELLYVLMTFHCVLLFIGGHYTYAEVPAFNWLRDTYHLSRNHYDRVGHFFQGVVPAMIARELLLRTSPLKPGKWLFAIIALSCLGISASYEIVECLVSIYTGEGVEAFLGTQGDIWDTQKDMMMALGGAIVALLTLSRWHDKLLARVAA